MAPLFAPRLTAVEPPREDSADLVSRASLAPILLAGLIGAVWLNQGVSHTRATAITDSIRDPLHHPLDAARYVTVELYERSGDEEIDFAVANATRGLPYDEDRLLRRGHDTPASFGRAPAVDGRWHRPYVEVPFEYPAAMVPFVLAPSLLGGRSFEVYTRLLGALMTAILLCAASVAIRAQPGRGERERWWAMAALLLAQGSLSVQRLDAVPALLLAVAVWAAARRKPATTGVALGLATAVKLFPALLVPLVVVADRDGWSGGRARARGAIAFGAAAGLGFLPMLFPPDALLDLLRYHGARGLHVESTLGALLGLWHVVTGEARPATLSYGSYNLDGAVAGLLARLCAPLMLALFGAAVVGIGRRAPARSDVERCDRVALALLTGLAALWLSAKAFSPQYLTWAMPLVLCVSGACGRRLTWLLFAIMTLTQVYMRAFYGQVIAGTVVGVGFLIVRLPLLVAFAVAAWRGAAPAPALPRAVEA